MITRMLDVPAQGKRRRERNRWKDSCKSDMESVGLKEEGILYRTKWKRDIDNHSGDPR